MMIAGSCHCGNVSFTLEWRPAPARIPARACGCGFCVKHGGVWTSCPAGNLRVKVRDATRTVAYQFGTRTADFQVCTVCGVVPLVTSRIDGRLYAVVSVNVFDNVDEAMLERIPTSFVGESEGDRLARRARNWIGDVVFES